MKTHLSIILGKGEFMKNIMMILVLGFSLDVVGATLEPIPTQRVYTPKGFDSNDSAEVIVTGFLPNLCYRNPKHKVVQNGSDLSITVEATKIEESYCPEVIVPYLEVVDLGVLDPRKYTVHVNEKTQTPLRESIEIVQRSRGRIDEAIYPIVFNVKYKKSDNTILIEGYKPSDCFEFDRVEFYSDRKNLITVLPKMKKIRDFCPRKLMPVSVRRKLPNLVNSVVTLIHVRSLNQESKNLEIAY